MESSSKVNYQIYKYILHLDMQNVTVYSTKWIGKIKEILQRCGLFKIWVNQHNIRIEDSKASKLMGINVLRYVYVVVAYLGFHFMGGSKYVWKSGGICRLLGGFGGMLPREKI